MVVTLSAVATGVAVAWQAHRQFCLSRAKDHAAAYQEAAISGGALANLSDEELVAAWKEIDQQRAREDEVHQRLSDEYLQAVWQPWLRLWITDPFVEPDPNPPKE